MGQVWYPYAAPFQPCVPTQQCPYPGVSPHLIVTPGTTAHTMDAVLRFTGDAVVAGAAAWLDLDPATVACPGPAPSLMYSDLWLPDWSIVSGSPPWVWPLPAIVPEGGPAGAGAVLLGSQGSLGWAFSVDVVSSPGPSFGVAVARLAWAVGAWPPGTVLTVQLHVLANLIHERDGSGWAFMTWTGMLAL